MELDPKNSNAYLGIGKNDCLKKQTVYDGNRFLSIFGKRMALFSWHKHLLGILLKALMQLE